jgi:FtsP/CotA-like multicopper oxidase with cupredoxin domain
MCANPCVDMTNLHFHGLSVSPDAPQDDVLTMLAKPGQVLHYSVRIPGDHPPGLFWYHTIRMARASGRCWTESQEPSSLREWNVMSPS